MAGWLHPTFGYCTNAAKTITNKLFTNIFFGLNQLFVNIAKESLYKSKLLGLFSCITKKIFCWKSVCNKYKDYYTRNCSKELLCKNLGQDGTVAVLWEGCFLSVLVDAGRMERFLPRLLGHWYGYWQHSQDFSTCDFQLTSVPCFAIPAAISESVFSHSCYLSLSSFFHSCPLSQFFCHSCSLSLFSLTLVI